MTKTQKNEKAYQERMKSPVLLELAQGYVIANLLLGLEKDKVVPIQKELLSKYKFVTARQVINGKTLEPEPIYEVKDLYLSEETAKLEEFYQELHDRLVNAGYTLAERGTCPILIAENHILIIQKGIVDALADVTGITYSKLAELGDPEAIDNYVKTIVSEIAKLHPKEFALEALTKMTSPD